jgi:prepilin-type processing-associated H-X9-DG protein
MEVLVVIGLIALLMGILLPAVERVRHRAYIADCASNLRQLGQFMSAYSNDHHGQLPRTVYVPGAAVQRGTNAAAADPFKPGGPLPNDVTAAVFLLLRTVHCSPAILDCPYNDVHEWTPEPGDPFTRSNFTDIKKYLGYSIANPYPDGAAASAGAYKWTGRLTADFALAADINPGNLKPYDDVLTPTASSPWNIMKKANSENHERDGQNVLYGDGHVSWTHNPFCGVAADNIYTTRDGQVEASPVDRADSVLLPTDD